jgi:uncharacterized protein YbjT (DUF2867 family)
MFSHTMKKKPAILLTGATGYIGGRLLGLLQHNGYRVRCLARRPQALKHREKSGTEILFADVLKPETLIGKFKDIDVAFYLVHSMGAKKDFVSQDREAARQFSRIARAEGVKRIIYLGGLANPGHVLSKHLRSRLEVADCLRETGIQVIEFRASIILGSGSASFEMIRSLVERLPIMLIPQWVRMLAQPIAVTDVLDYLLAAIHLETGENTIFEIGGADRLSYADLMKEYAHQRGLKRLMIPVPFLTPRLSSLWLGLVTPLYARLGKKLIGGIKTPTIVRDDSALKAFDIRPKPVREAIADALFNEDREFAETRWSDTLSSSGAVPSDWGGVRFGNRLVDSRKIHVNVPPEKAFAPILTIGGATGWYYANWLWRLRGFIDLLLGGVGMGRGRRHARKINIGDTIDFWRVEAFEPHRRLRLYAEMKLPGHAWLEFSVKPLDQNHTIIYQTNIFDPIGLLGLLYWYALFPLHALVFKGMIRNIGRAAEKNK